MLIEDRKKAINHFIKWITYVQDDDKEQEQILLDILDNYIDCEHYDFIQFKEEK